MGRTQRGVCSWVTYFPLQQVTRCSGGPAGTYLVVRGFLVQVWYPKRLGNVLRSIWTNRAIPQSSTHKLFKQLFNTLFTLLTIANFMCNILRDSESQFLSPPRRKQIFSCVGVLAHAHHHFPALPAGPPQCSLSLSANHTHTLYTGRGEVGRFCEHCLLFCSSSFGLLTAW